MEKVTNNANIFVQFWLNTLMSVPDALEVMNTLKGVLSARLGVK